MTVPDRSYAVSEIHLPGKREHSCRKERIVSMTCEAPWLQNIDDWGRCEQSGSMTWGGGSSDCMQRETLPNRTFLLWQLLSTGMILM